MKVLVASLVKRIFQLGKDESFNCSGRFEFHEKKENSELELDSERGLLPFLY